MKKTFFKLIQCGQEDFYIECWTLPVMILEKTHISNILITGKGSSQRTTLLPALK